MAQQSRNKICNEICENIEKGKECDTDFKECVVSVENLFDDTHVSVKTSFVNIILPIKDAFDDAGSQKGHIT